MTWATHSSAPATFLPQPTSQPHGSSEHDPSLSREHLELSRLGRSRSIRRWARQVFLPRSSSEGRGHRPRAGWDEDSGYDSCSSSLSSSSGTHLAFEHPTHGRPHLRIRDTDDYLTVQNPNPHTGEMSPSVLSLVSERTEPPSPSATACPPSNPAEALHLAHHGTWPQQREQRAKRWRPFGRTNLAAPRERPPTPPEHRTQPPPVPPKVSFENEEPPEALDSSTQPLQSQPPSTHYAAFDPDHLRVPGALTITPPLKTVTNGGTDAITTWVATESRRVYELPAGPLTPGGSPPPICAPAPQRVGVAGPRVMRPQSRSPIQVARSRSYSSGESRDFCVSAQHQRRGEVQGPREPRRVCSIPRKPVATEYVAVPFTPNVPDDITRPSPNVSPISLDCPPPPPLHRQVHAPAPPPPTTAPIPVAPVERVRIRVPTAPPAPAIADTSSRATQTRASVAGQTYKRHPIQPSYETPTVRAQTRLNGTGVQRLVVTTGKRSVPEKATQTMPDSATKGTQTTTPRSPTKAHKSTSTAAPATARDPPPPKTTKTATKPPIGAAPPPTKPARAKLTKPPPTSPAKPAKPAAASTAKRPVAANTAKKPVIPYSASAVLAARRATVAGAAAAAPPAAPAPAAAVRTERADAAQQPLISIRVSRQAVVRTLQLVAAVWAVVAAAYLLSAVGRALVVVFWPVGLVFRGLGVLAGCVRGGGWGR